MEEVRASWKVAAISHWVKAFSKLFKLERITVDDIEEFLLATQFETANTFFVEFLCQLLQQMRKVIVTTTNLNEYFFKIVLDAPTLIDSELLDVIRDAVEHSKNFLELDFDTKCDLLLYLFLARLDKNASSENPVMISPDEMRTGTIGVDKSKHEYFYFGDNRLYKSYVTKKVSKWQVVCHELDDWKKLIISLGSSRNKSEKELLETINEEIEPNLEGIFKEKEKLLHHRLLLLAPKRTSHRLESKREASKHARALINNLAESEASDSGGRRSSRSARKIEESDWSLNMEQTEEEKEEARKQLQEAREARVRRRAEGLPASFPDEEGDTKGNERDEEEAKMYVETIGYIIQQIENNSDSLPFREPVKISDVPDYGDIVKQPMDLLTMEYKLLEKRANYEITEFVSDFDLIINNCVMYNGSETWYGVRAKKLSRSFQGLLNQFFKEQAKLRYKRGFFGKVERSTGPVMPANREEASRKRPHSPPPASLDASKIPRLVLKVNNNNEHNNDTPSSTDNINKIDEYSLHDDSMDNESSSSVSSSPSSGHRPTTATTNGFIPRSMFHDIPAPSPILAHKQRESARPPILHPQPIITVIPHATSSSHHLSGNGSTSTPTIVSKSQTSPTSSSSFTHHVTVTTPPQLLCQSAGFRTTEGETSSTNS